MNASITERRCLIMSKGNDISIMLTNFKGLTIISGYYKLIPSDNVHKTILDGAELEYANEAEKKAVFLQNIKKSNGDFVKKIHIPDEIKDAASVIEDDKGNVLSALVPSGKKIDDKLMAVSSQTTDMQVDEVPEETTSQYAFRKRKHSSMHLEEATKKSRGIQSFPLLLYVVTQFFYQ